MTVDAPGKNNFTLPFDVQNQQRQETYAGTCQRVTAWRHGRATSSELDTSPRSFRCPSERSSTIAEQRAIVDGARWCAASNAESSSSSYLRRARRLDGTPPHPLTHPSARQSGAGYHAPQLTPPSTSPWSVRLTWADETSSLSGK